MQIVSKRLIITLAWAAFTTVGCSEDRQSAPVAPNVPSTAAEGASVGRPDNPGAASDRMLFQVRLRPLGDSRATGVMLFEIVDGYFTARVHAAGLTPGEHIPQHIHLNPTCNPGGNILINLDERLTVAGEGPGVGETYPIANAGGVITYEARRSLEDLLEAVNTHQNLSLQTVAELIAWLDLEDRNGHMHVAFGPPFPAVNCGEMERIN